MVAEKVRELEQENENLKAQLEELLAQCGDRAEQPKNCEYCGNFIQHYIKTGNSYYPTYNGHCKASRMIGHKKTVDSTCKSYIKKEYGKNYI